MKLRDILESKKYNEWHSNLPVDKPPNGAKITIKYWKDPDENNSEEEREYGEPAEVTDDAIYNKGYWLVNFKEEKKTQVTAHAWRYRK
jgi:hypothetical protein